MIKKSRKMLFGRISVILLLVCGFAHGQIKVKNFDRYTVGYDSIGTHYAFYRLTKEMVYDQKKQKRLTRFKQFNDTKHGDYTNSGFDRGHLVPADAQSYDKSAYDDTFSLANIVPMHPNLNRRSWRFIEEYEQDLATYKGCVLIRIKVEYSKKKIGKLTIPNKLIKIIADCSGEVIAEYSFLNDIYDEKH